MIKIAALYKHWCVADSVKPFITALVPDDGTSGFPQEAIAFAQAHSSFMRLSVWYALLQVVVEGYKELGLKDPAVDELLAHGNYVVGLRRFRNAMFHYQEDPLSEKLLGFLQTDDSTWARRLNSAFKSYFERTLPVHETLDALKNA